MNESPKQTVCFVDDSPDFLETLEQKAKELGMPVRTTSDPEECLAWVEQGEVGELIADLRLDMEEDGLAIIEKAQKYGQIRTSILTGFAPTQWEASRARRLGVQIHMKDYLAEFLEEIAKTSISGWGRGTPAWPVEATSQLITEAQNMLLNWLQGRKERDSAVVYYQAKPYSVNDLIREIEARTELGQAQLTLFIKVIRKEMGL